MAVHSSVWEHWLRVKERMVKENMKTKSISFSLFLSAHLCHTVCFTQWPSWFYLRVRKEEMCSVLFLLSSSLSATTGYLIFGICEWFCAWMASDTYTVAVCKGTSFYISTSFLWKKRCKIHGRSLAQMYLFACEDWMLRRTTHWSHAHCDIQNSNANREQDNSLKAQGTFVVSSRLTDGTLWPFPLGQLQQQQQQQQPGWKLPEDDLPPWSRLLVFRLSGLHLYSEVCWLQGPALVNSPL